MADRQRIEVRHVMNGTTCNDRWWAAESSVTLGPDETTVELTDGTDKAGRRVLSAQYGPRERVVRYLEVDGG